MSCPLCRSPAVRRLAHLHGRHFLDCPDCRLVFVDPGDRLDSAAQLRHYETHRNDPEDARYRAFLSRLADPLVSRLPAGAHGLDFGSGPGPTLPVILRERGFAVDLFDPFFSPDPPPAGSSYDFITCTEVVEHFHHPAEEFERLHRLLRPGGWFGIMTELLREGQPLQTWRYARDPTHVSFYRRSTMDWLAGRLKWIADFPAPNVVLFQKGQGAA